MLVLALGMIGLSEAGEVVVLETHAAGGAPRHTRLWVVDDGGREWLRAGQPASAWVVNLRADPEVALERAGKTRRYRAVVVEDPAVRDRVHALMGEKYGLADRLIALLFRDGAVSRPVRLDPLDAP